MSLPRFETERLGLRPRTLDDVEATLAMDTDPRVARFIWGPPPEARAHRLSLIARTADGWPRVGGAWVVEWKDKAGLIGLCGLFPLDHGEDVEIAYRYLPTVWGRGVASEAAVPVLAYGFEVLGLRRIVALTDPDNAASKRVLAKLGFAAVGTGFHFGRTLDVAHLEAPGQS